MIRSGRVSSRPACCPSFVDVAEVFPGEVRHVPLCLKKVYRTDAAAKRFKLSDKLRLRISAQALGTADAFSSFAERTCG